MRIARRAFLTGVAGTGLPLVRSATAADPAEPVTQLHQALIALMRAGRETPFPQRFRQIASTIDRTFDLETILRVSIGSRWEQLNQTIQGALEAAFRGFTIATYVANFDRYEGERFETLAPFRSSGRDRIVQTQLFQASGIPVRLDYVTRLEGSTWRIVDVLMNGTISRVALQRSDFRALLARGDAEALIASLQQKISDLSDGSMQG